MKVALVHDWFVGGGAERVVYELSKMYPSAPIYTAYCSDEWLKKLGADRVNTSYMQTWPFSKMRKFLPILRAIWFSRLDLSNYDLVISSSGAEAKAVKVKKPSVHINYCHAPTHYYWSRYDEYMNNPGFGWLNLIARLGLKLLVEPMRRWDKRAATRPQFMIANSNYTKDQIKKYYGRDSVVIHPPVEVEKFRPKTERPVSGFLVVGRQTPYKRLDLAISACTKLGLPLVVASDGPQNRQLKKIAGPTIEFVGWLSDNERVKYFQKAEGFIFPGLDDFGIVAVEAMATGTAVIAYKGGGALDYVIPGKTGEFFDEQSAESLSEALNNFQPKRYDSDSISNFAKQFSHVAFRSNMLRFIDDLPKIKPVG